MAKQTVSEEELKQYVSLTTVQTKGLKRTLQESKIESFVHNLETNNSEESTEPIANSLKGVKKRRIAILNNIKKHVSNKDPNVLDIDVSDNHYFD